MHIHRKKASQYFKSLKNFSTSVLPLYCNVVVHNNQAEAKKDQKHFTEPPCYTYVQQNKQALIVAADAVQTQTLTLIPASDFLEEFLSILIHTQSSRF